MGARKFVFGVASSMGNPTEMFCPCVDCRNVCHWLIQTVLDHLVIRGMDEKYKRNPFWSKHGEKRDKTAVVFPTSEEEAYELLRTASLSLKLITKINMRSVRLQKIMSLGRRREQQASQVAFLAQRSHVSAGNNDKSTLVCSSCKRTGHMAETCFQVIGYPELWGDRSRRGGRGGREAGRGRGSISRANAVVTQPLHDVSVECERSGYTGLTNEQQSTLIKYLDEKQGTLTRLNGVCLSL
ncbi:hypothetical protein CARUB_v10028038mg [Capsella rubella]|uniref:Transposase-associated domain-containing protein n=1 Tax=Capsella rubella TaxID=81985 RepID=R0EUD3_9BRAS|nr:hypothetical protein CARUB_v10028038mg [Capsella rubella]